MLEYSLTYFIQLVTNSGKDNVKTKLKVHFTHKYKYKKIPNKIQADCSWRCCVLLRSPFQDGDNIPPAAMIWTVEGPKLSDFQSLFYTALLFCRVRNLVMAQLDESFSPYDVDGR